MAWLSCCARTHSSVWERRRRRVGARRRHENSRMVSFGGKRVWARSRVEVLSMAVVKWPDHSPRRYRPTRWASHSAPAGETHMRMPNHPLRMIPRPGAKNTMPPPPSQWRSAASVASIRLGYAWPGVGAQRSIPPGRRRRQPPGRGGCVRRNPHGMRHPQRSRTGTRVQHNGVS